MHLARATAVTVTALLAFTLLGVSALQQLRAPEGAAALGRTLADDPAVHEVLVTTLVDAIVADATERSPTITPLEPLLRPLLERAVETAVTSPAGRAAVAAALADAIQQLTLPGPIVIDLRTAALAAVTEIPPPLDTLSRAAIEQGAIGVVVLGADGTSLGPQDASDGRAGDFRSGAVAGMPGDRAVTLSGLLLLGGVGALVLPRSPSRRARRISAGVTLALVGGAAAATIRFVPAALTARLVEQDGVAGGPFAAIVAALVDGVGDLLAATGTLAAVMAVAGVLLVTGAVVTSRSGAVSAVDASG